MRVDAQTDGQRRRELRHNTPYKGDSHLNTHSNSPSRARLFGGSASVAVAAMLIAGPAFAQTPAPAKTAAAEATDEESTIVVTGSLIKNPNLTRATPVNVTTSEEINLKQTNVAEDLLRDIPGVVPNIGSSVNNGNGGASYVDLRGLGSNRNLVLLNGERIAPSDSIGRVDLNNIPLALVDRVEVLTGGASTTYGADAISGVVNFITKRDFTGVEVSASNQLTEKGDGKYFRTDITIGGNFADGKGNATLSIGFQESDPVYQGDRDFGAFQFSSFSGGISGSGLAPVPSRFSFQGGGVGANRVNGTRQLDPATGAVRTTGPGTYAPFNFNPYNLYQTPFTRYNIFGTAHYEISPAFEVYTRALFSKNTVQTIVAPSGSFASSVKIPLSNPYLPAALRTQFCNNNDFDAITAGIQTLTPEQCAAAATATNPTNADGSANTNYKVVTTNLNRRLVEGGPRISNFQTTIFDYRLGVRGAITDHLSYDISGGYGESENTQRLGGYVLTSRLRDALLATNTTTCLSGNAGCVPVNVFGAAGTIAQNQIGYITGPASITNRSSIAQAKAGISGDFGITSPGAADPISFAVGTEYRKYKASQIPDFLSAQAGELGGSGGAAPAFAGGYEVVEGYGELIAPLVQDKPLFHSLTVSGGIRYSHYNINSAQGNSFNTTTYKGEVVWEPAQGFKLRGNYSRAVRAPNIFELFQPVTTQLTNLGVDPCAGTAVNSNANLRAVCLAQGAPAAALGGIEQPAVASAGQVNITTGGNTRLLPETSDSYSGGVVFQPTFISGFSVSADYYHIKIKNAITVPTPGDIIQNCFGNVTAASASSLSCTAIRRNPATGDLAGDPATTGGLFGVFTNQGLLLTDGIDVIANYRRDIGFAKLSLAFNGNYTFRSKFKSNQNDPASLDRECIGVYSVNCSSASGSIQPKFQWNQRTTLGFDRFDISVLWRHIDSVNQEQDDIDNGNGPAYSGPVPGSPPTVATTLSGIAPGAFGNQNFGHIKSFDYFDLSARVDVMKSLELTFTVQNLFDRNPPLTGTNIGSTTYNSGNTYPSTYDTLGRRYAVSARVRF